MARGKGSAVLILLRQSCCRHTASVWWLSSLAAHKNRGTRRQWEIWRCPAVHRVLTLWTHTQKRERCVALGASQGRRSRRKRGRWKRRTTATTTRSVSLFIYTVLLAAVVFKIIKEEEEKLRRMGKLWLGLWRGKSDGIPRPHTSILSRSFFFASSVIFSSFSSSLSFVWSPI